MMLPSFMYEGIHTIHHTRTRYGTVEDPEYLPLALMKPWTLPVFLIVSALMPVGLLLRFGVLGPLSLLSRRLRRLVVARYSGLQINPKFERKAPEGAFARQWRWQEIGAGIVAVTLIATVATGMLPLRALLIYMGIISGVAVLNQVRTLVAHLWENEGEPLTVTAQFLDSVNVPNGPLPWLWAPVGLRFHALHHLLPSLPYHALAEAHRRISESLGQGSTYEAANYPTLRGLIGRLASSTMNGRRSAVGGRPRNSPDRHPNGLICFQAVCCGSLRPWRPTESWSCKSASSFARRSTAPDGRFSSRRQASFRAWAALRRSGA